MKTTTILAAHGLLLLATLGWPGRAAAQQLPRPAPAPAYRPYERTDRSSPIGGDLQRLYRHWAQTEGRPVAATPELREAFANLLFDPTGRTVLVQLTARDVAGLREALAGRGFVVKSSHPELHFVEGYVPLAQLAPGAAGLAALAGQGLMGVLPVHRPATNRAARAAASGPVVSQAAYLLQAERVRALGGYDGRGVRVGVMSDSYDFLGTAAAGTAAGELPAEGVRVLQDFQSNGSDEGQGMCELVHDVAPGSPLVFSSVFYGQGDFADQIRRLADPAVGNCRVLTDDVYYFGEPVYQAGVISQAVAAVRAQGAAYFTSAGNNASNAYVNEAPVFVPMARPGGDTELDFNNTGTGAASPRQHVPLLHGRRFLHSLWWSNPYYTTGGVQTDLDVFLISSRGDTVAASADNSRLNQVPNESSMDFNNDTTRTHSTSFYLHIVKRAGSPTPARLRADAFANQPDEWLTNSPTTLGHALAPEATTVGAVPFYNLLVPEPFTAKSGGTYLFGPTGTPLAAPLAIAKPDLAAPDGCDTRFFLAPNLAGNDFPTNGYPNFFGTSAAAPHAAAVAALLWQAQPALTAAQLLARLASTARDVSVAGVDDRTGAGLVDAYTAIYGVPTPAVPTAAQPWVDDLNRGGLARAWDISTVGPARPWVRAAIGPASGRHHLVLDAGAQNRASFSVALATNTSAATLAANLAGAATNGWYLSFRHKRIAGETNEVLPAQFTTRAVGDGVSLSVDGGTTWRRLVDLTTLTNTTYQTQSVNLSQFAQAQSLTLGANVRLRFQQSGPTSADSTGGTRRGGWAFDDVALSDGPLGVLPLFTSTTATGPCTGLTVTFADASLNAPAGATYQWSFPGGTPASSTAASPVVSYATAGRYNVSLTIGGVTRTDTAYVQLEQRAPVPVATADRSLVCPNAPVQFTATAAYCATGYQWRFPGGSPASSTAASPTVSYATPGTYPVTLVARNALGSDSVRTLRIQVKPTATAPVAEPFAATGPPAYWDLVNPDHLTTWIVTQATGPDGQLGYAAAINYFDYIAQGERDQLVSLPVTLPATMPRATLRFAVAYAPYPRRTDSLLVRVVSRCAPYPVLGTVYRKGGTGLATAPVRAGRFYPTSARQWRAEAVDLTAYRGQDVAIAFEGYNGLGNVVFVDDFSIDAQALLATSAARPATGLLAWPSPVAGGSALTVETPASPAPAALRLLDALGRPVWQGTAPAAAGPARQTLAAPLPPGVYVLHYRPAAGPPLVQRVVVE